ISDLNRCLGDERKLLPISRDICPFKRLSYGVELIVRSGNNILILLACQLFRARLEGELEETVLVHRIARHGDLAFLLKHVRTSSGGSEVAAVLAENAADPRGGASFVVGCRFHY